MKHTDAQSVALSNSERLLYV